MVIVIVLPLFQLRVEEVNVVGNAIANEKLVKLLVIDAMGAFDLAIEMWRPRADVHVPDIEIFEMPVEM
jgi:hypothetical protein